MLCVALAPVLLLSGCELFAASGMVRRELHGLQFQPSLEKPSFVARATTGEDYDFRASTDGDVALLFFGFTNCPDICPAHMHNLAAVLRKMPESEASRVHIVFVTTDPERDTDERLRVWLSGIHPRIIGVRPSVDEAIRVQSALGIQPAVVLAAKPGHEGNYDVGHAAQVIAFTPDNRARFAYAAGTRQADWARDIPLLLKGKWKD